MSSLAFGESKDITNGIEAYPIPLEQNVAAVGSPSFFQYIKTNIPGELCNQEKFHEQFAGCSCQDSCTSEHCSCLKLFGYAYKVDGNISEKIFEGDITRPILECGHDCSCNKDLCHNRVVQKGIRIQLAVFLTTEKNYGLKLANNAGHVVPLGSFICEYAGEVVEQYEAQRRMKQTESGGECNYLIALREYVNGKETCTYIDPRHKGNIGRFINHSCDPNLIMVPVRVNHQVPRLALFARKNIMPGEELTFDYSGQISWQSLSVSTTASPVNHKTACKFQEIVDVRDDAVCHECEGNIKRRVASYYSVDLRSPCKKLKTATGRSLCRIHMPLHTTRHQQTNARQEQSQHLSVCEDESCHAPVGSMREWSDFTVKDTYYCCHNDTLIQADNDIAKVSVQLTAEDKKEVSCADLVQSKSEMVERPKRKPCYCKSSNCSGVLPFDDRLFCNDLVI